MSPVTETHADCRTAVDLAERFGPIPLNRIRFLPVPGSARVQDVIEVYRHERRACELVDGVLVEKTVGYLESCIACLLIRRLANFVAERDLGVVAGEGGMLRLMLDLVRIPDVSYVSWARLPSRQIPQEAVPHLVPDLAVEVLSEGNTTEEMARKIRDYFAAGVRLVWFVDPRARRVEVYTAPDRLQVLGGADTLDGGEVLPGFTMPITELMAAGGTGASA